MLTRRCARRVHLTALAIRIIHSIDEKLRYANIVTLLERRQRLRHLYQHDLARYVELLINQFRYRVTLSAFAHF